MRKRDFQNRSALVLSRRGLLVLLASCALVVTAYGQAHAASVAVNGTCTFREAVDTVNNQSPEPGCAFTGQAPPAGCTFPGGSDLIIVPSGTFTDTGHPVTGDPIEITRNAWVCGNGVGVSTLRGNMATSSFFIRAIDYNAPEGGNAMNVTLEGLTISHTSGYAFVTGVFGYQVGLHLNKVRVTGFGASGVWGQDADIYIDDSTIETNSAFSNGGGILFENPSGPFATRNNGIVMQRSTVASNTAGQSGGGLYYAGYGNSNIINSTFTGNTAVDGGGAAKDPAAPYLFFTSSTIAGNTGTNRGGGLSTTGDASAQGMKLIRTIVGQNTSPTGPDVYGPVNDFNDSLMGNTSGATITSSSGVVLVNVSPNLDLTPRDLGGTYHTKVLRPRPGSPAIDVLTSTVELTDQRGVRRPQLGGPNATKRDIGAVEISRLETEALTVAAKSSDAHVPVSNSSYSNGQGTNLQANAANDFVTYSSPASLPSGTYNITIGFKKGSNEGQFQFGYGTASGGPFTNVGAVQDAYASSTSYVTVNLGNVTFASSGTKYFRFFVTGKNASSTSYQVFPDFVEVTKQ